MKYRVPEINRGKFEKAGIQAIAGKLASLTSRMVVDNVMCNPSIHFPRIYFFQNLRNSENI